MKYYKKTKVLPFDTIDIQTVAHYAGLNFNLQIYSPFRWTPLIQRMNQSDEFLKKMRYFQRLKIFEDKHQGELIDTFLFEALKQTEFDYYYDYKCNPGSLPFYGTADFLIYHKEKQMPIVPVLKDYLNEGFTGIGKARSMNSSGPIAAGVWALDNMFTAQQITVSRVIQTDGNHWRLYELTKQGQFRQTGVYYGDNQFNKIYYDYEMQKVILGLIRYSLNQPTENEQALKVVYDFVDEKMLLTEGDKPKPSKFWNFLPQSIRDIFINN
ncbi:hypothetical protein pb186bvf_017562 [Paramecium bursaria]